MEGVILKVFFILATQRYEGLYREKKETQRGNGREGYVLSKVFLIWRTCFSFVLFDWSSTTEHKLLGLVSISLRILVLSCKWAIAVICMLCVTWQYIERKTKGALGRLTGILSSVTIKDCLEHWTKQEGHRPSRRIVEQLWKLFWKGQAPKSCYTLTST